MAYLPQSGVKAVLTKLQDDDALYEPKDPTHSLQDMYGVVARDIVEKYNGVKWDKKAIDDWVMGTGGWRRPYVESNPFDKERQLGWASFGPNSRIWLPPGGPRLPVEAPPAPRVAGLTWKGYATIATIVVGGLLAIFGGSDD